MPRLSVIMITRNEQSNIARTLQAVQWADECIVLDSGSTDDTVAIARSWGARVYQQTWLGFGPQKNKALDYATGDWVLSLDADEVVSSALRRDIEQVVADNPQAAFQIQRHNFFCGQRLRYVWNNDWVLRLFRRGSARFSDQVVHEALELRDASVPIRRLQGHIDHYSVASLDQYLATMNNYTSLAAERDYQAGKQASLWKVGYKTLFMFVKSYVFKKGFLDGRLGLVVSVLNAQSKFYQYLKLNFLVRFSSR